jgi:hypothetical protein
VEEPNVPELLVTGNARISPWPLSPDATYNTSSGVDVVLPPVPPPPVLVFPPFDPPPHANIAAQMAAMQIADNRLRIAGNETGFMGSADLYLGF